MTDDSWQCDECSGRKSLFFERAPGRVLFGVLLIIVYFVLVVPRIPDSLGGLILMYLLGGLALLPIVGTLRIRCLECEPEWKSRMWGSRD